MTEDHQPATELPQRTSAVLRELAYGGTSAEVSAHEIVAGLRHRALGFSLFLFSLPCCLPMPPGIATLCGFVVALIALHLIAARQTLWLPQTIARRTINRHSLQKMAARALPPLEWLEKFLRPRLLIVTSAALKVVTGVIVLIMGLILILPIPFLGNLPPGIATTVIALGLSERDGIVILVGWLFCAAAAAITYTMGLAAITGLQSLI